MKLNNLYFKLILIFILPLLIPCAISAQNNFSYSNLVTEKQRLGSFFYEYLLSDEAVRYFDLALNESETIKPTSLQYLHYALSSKFYRRIELLEQGLELILDKQSHDYIQMAEELKKQKESLSRWNYHAPDPIAKEANSFYRTGKYRETVEKYEQSFKEEKYKGDFLYYVRSLRHIGQEDKAEKLLKDRVVDPLIDDGIGMDQRDRKIDGTYRTEQREILDIYLKQGKITLNDIKNKIANEFGPSDTFFNHYMIFCFREKKYQEVMETICTGIFEGRTCFSAFWGIIKGKNKPEPLKLMIQYEFTTLPGIINFADKYSKEHPNTDEGLRAKFLAAELYYPLLQDYENGFKRFKEISADTRSQQLTDNYFNYYLSRFPGNGPYVINSLEVTSDSEVTIADVCQKRIEEIIYITNSTVMGKLVANVDLKPDTLNLKSNGKWVTAYIELPSKYNAQNIDISSILLNDTLPCEASPTQIGDFDQDSVSDLMVKFDRSKVKPLLKSGETYLTITGKLADGKKFEGMDVVKVISNDPPELKVQQMQQTGSIVTITIKNQGELPADNTKITKVTTPKGIICSTSVPVLINSPIQPGQSSTIILQFNTNQRVRFGFEMNWEDEEGNVYTK